MGFGGEGMGGAPFMGGGGSDMGGLGMGGLMGGGGDSGGGMLGSLMGGGGGDPMGGMMSGLMGGQAMTGGGMNLLSMLGGSQGGGGLLSSLMGGGAGPGIGGTSGPPTGVGGVPTGGSPKEAMAQSPGIGKIGSDSPDWMTSPGKGDFGGKGPEIRPDSKVTFYAPGVGDKMQGGWETSKPGPDGVAKPKTLDDFRLGKSDYITVASDPSNYGKSMDLGTVQYRSPMDGQKYTIDNVQGYVHDTGSAFKGKPNKFDIPVGDFRGWGSKDAMQFVSKGTQWLGGGSTPAAAALPPPGPPMVAPSNIPSPSAGITGTPPVLQGSRYDTGPFGGAGQNTPFQQPSQPVTSGAQAPGGVLSGSRYDTGPFTGNEKVAALPPPTNSIQLPEMEVTASKPMGTLQDYGAAPRGANFMRGQFGPAGENIVPVPGISGGLHREAAPALQGFVNDLKAAGAPIEKVGGYSYRNIAGTKTISQHAYGNAIDINQTGRNTSSLKGWAEQNQSTLRDLQAKWGVSSGGDWKNPDFGHFEWSGQKTAAYDGVSKVASTGPTSGAPPPPTGELPAGELPPRELPPLAAPQPDSAYRTGGGAKVASTEMNLGLPAARTMTRQQVAAEVPQQGRPAPLQGRTKMAEGGVINPLSGLFGGEGGIFGGINKQLANPSPMQIMGLALLSGKSWDEGIGNYMKMLPYLQQAQLQKAQGAAGTDAFKRVFGEPTLPGAQPKKDEEAPNPAKQAVMGSASAPTQVAQAPAPSADIRQLEAQKRQLDQILAHPSNLAPESRKAYETMRHDIEARLMKGIEFQNSVNTPTGPMKEAKAADMSVTDFEANKTLQVERSKEKAKLEKDLADSAKSAATMLPNIDNAISSWEKAVKAGAVGPSEGSAVTRFVSRYIPSGTYDPKTGVSAAPLFPSATREAEEARQNYERAVSPIRAFITSAQNKGQGPVSEWERKMYMLNLPGVDVYPTAGELQNLKDIREDMQRSIKAGKATPIGNTAGMPETLDYQRTPPPAQPQQAPQQQAPSLPPGVTREQAISEAQAAIPTATPEQRKQIMQRLRQWGVQ